MPRWIYKQNRIELLPDSKMLVYMDERKAPFMIDESDFECVSYYTWHKGPHSRYVKTHLKINGAYRDIALHRFLFGDAPEGLMWDHINRNTLDNTRTNLRVVTSSINNRNRGMHADNTSGFKGVCKHRNHWRADISYDGIRFHLGTFDTIEEAVEARKAAEKEMWSDA